MTTVETYLLAVAFVLFAALVIVIALGRITAREADQLAEQRDTERAKARHYQDRNTQLRAELDGHAARADLAEAFIASLTTADMPTAGGTR